MPTDKLFFNTVNMTKMTEIREIFADCSCEVKFLNNNITEILSHDIEQVIKAKASEAYRKCRVPVVVEHGALCVNYFNGFPGALSKPMWDLMGDGICKLIPEHEDRTATVYSGVCYCDGIKRLIFIGETKGTIAKYGRGSNGFQWDPIFIPEGESKTYGEMTQTEKLKFSQAAKAYKKLKEELSLK